MAEDSDAERQTFRHVVRVGWADCDPAKIAYTGRIPYFALEAIDAFWEAAVGADWFAMNVDRDFGSPFVHMSFDFRSPVTPRHRLVCEVRLHSLGESSVGLGVTGTQNGRLCFESRFVEVTVAAQAHKKIPIPDDIRRELSRYLAENKE
jgi:acyl-CoA thioesterase FadM